MTSFQLTANSSNSAAAEFWSSWVPLWALSLPSRLFQQSGTLTPSHFIFLLPCGLARLPLLSLMPRVPPTGGRVCDASEGRAAAAPARHPPAADSGEGRGFPREGARQRLPPARHPPWGYVAAAVSGPASPTAAPPPARKRPACSGSSAATAPAKVRPPRLLFHPLPLLLLLLFFLLGQGADLLRCRPGQHYPERHESASWVGWCVGVGLLV
jgi:hypothetical protein